MANDGAKPKDPAPGSTRRFALDSVAVVTVPPRDAPDGPVASTGAPVPPAVVAALVAHADRVPADVLDLGDHDGARWWAQRIDAATFLVAPDRGAELSASRFFENAPVVAWATNDRGETLLFGGLATGGPGEPKRGRIPLDEVFDADTAKRYRAHNATVIATGSTMVSTEEGVPVSALGAPVYQVARFPIEPPALGAFANGETREAGGIAIEITDRVRMTDALARSEAQLRAMLEATNDGVWVVDADFRTTWTNRALREILGYSEEEMAGVSPLDYVAVDARERAAAAWKERVAGKSDSGEWRLVTKDGRTLWLMTSAAPIHSPDGVIHGAIAIVKDVTARKEEEARARRDAEREQEMQRLEVLARLAGGIAHDFNNLLTAVVTGADMLAEELASPHPASETVETIRQAGRRASALCRQLLALSGRGRFSLTAVDLHAVACGALRALRPTIDARHVVEVTRGPDLRAASGDEVQLQQLVSNLILNATEAIGPRPGTVTVHVDTVVLDAAALASTHLAPDLREGPYVRLCVTDDGPGLSRDVRERLFEPFVTTRTTGRGLGLAAVRGIVRGHRGAIRVGSEDGRGATFEVFLPAGEVLGSSPRPTSTVTPAIGRGELVLVVDDEMMVRTAACRVLQSRGFRTLEAPDGVRGVEVFRENASNIDVVLLDLSMPKMDGAETLVRIRELRPGIPAVIMSGYSEDETAARFVGVGLATFVAKPFTPDQLVQRLRSALASR